MITEEQIAELVAGPLPERRFHAICLHFVDHKDYPSIGSLLFRAVIGSDVGAAYSFAGICQPGFSLRLNSDFGRREKNSHSATITVGGAVIWAQDASGWGAVFTRGEYRELMMRQIPTFDEPLAFGTSGTDETHA